MPTASPLFFRTCIGLALCFLCLSVSAQKPNVIVILADDLGYGDMSCHGNPWLKTPQLDRLHDQSVSLDDFHTDPYCTPTRAALLTGRYSTRNGAWSVIKGRQLLNSSETTMAQIFSANGYRTGMFGKWHIGDPYPYAPQDRGFDEVVSHKAGGVDEIGNPLTNDYFDDTYYRNGVPEAFAGYCTDVFFREAQAFIHRSVQDNAQPFFVYLPLNAMHSPHIVEERYAAPYRAQGHPDERSRFYGMIANFDENLGRLMAMLAELDAVENTIVIFLGDNGTAQGISVDRDNLPDMAPDAKPTPQVGFNAGMRGKKGGVYEGGHRVSCFIRWPGQLKAGHSVDQLTSHHDLLPTLVDLCQLDTSRTSPKPLAFDGDSIAPLLKNDTAHWPQRMRFVDRQDSQPRPSTLSSPKDGSPPYAVMTERFRLVNGELYDIHTDPGQHHNIADDHPDLVKRLYAAYVRWFNDVASHQSAYTPFFIGNEHENPTTFTCRDWHPTQGRVFWSSHMLDDDTLWGNGYWAINTVRSGQYRITLSRRPLDALTPMKVCHARLKLGDAEYEQPLSPQDTSATFEVTLQEGEAKLQTWLQDCDTDKQRGAYFVTCEWIAPAQ